MASPSTRPATPTSPVRLQNAVFKADPTGVVTRIAGTGVVGYSGDGGPALSAQLNSPNGVAVDALGNVYIADSNNCRIRKVDGSGNITTVAGNGNYGYSGDERPGNRRADRHSLRSGGGRLGEPVYCRYQLSRHPQGGRFRNHHDAWPGSGTHGYSGDGGPATSAQVVLPVWRCRGRLRQLVHRGHAKTTASGRWTRPESSPRSPARRLLLLWGRRRGYQRSTGLSRRRGGGRLG